MNNAFFLAVVVLPCGRGPRGVGKGAVNPRLSINPGKHLFQCHVMSVRASAKSGVYMLRATTIIFCLPGHLSLCRRGWMKTQLIVKLYSEIGQSFNQLVSATTSSRGPGLAITKTRSRVKTYSRAKV